MLDYLKESFNSAKYQFNFVLSRVLANVMHGVAYIQNFIINVGDSISMNPKLKAHFAGLKAGLKNFFNYSFFNVMGYNVNFKNIFLATLLAMTVALPAIIVVAGLVSINPFLVLVGVFSVIPSFFAALKAAAIITAYAITFVAGASLVEQGLNMAFGLGVNLFSRLFSSSIRAGKEAANDTYVYLTGLDMHDNYQSDQDLSKDNVVDFAAKVIDGETVAVEDAKDKLEHSARRGVFFLRQKAEDCAHGLQEVVGLRSPRR